MTSIEPLPPSVSELLANSSKLRARYPSNTARQWRRSRIRPPLAFRLLGTASYADTPTAAFYRIYEFLVTNHNIHFRNELEYFCCSHPNWSISSLPDPKDPDPLRYAILAVLTKLMCDSFNRRIGLGLPRDAPAIIEDFAELEARPKVYEEPPEWAKRVQALPEKVFIPNVEGKKLDEDHEDVSEEFKAMNIIVQMPHIHFV
ncbi:hypothetical protein E1B28_011093 [Marasmius oreades]|uniref:Uncharacterized protein n=1 Tax=Marasmius oreades TaxID=181124 RepID=A0A9P7UPV0_9AGAR|nr:uncharacterized protein E1B28_011093 [Marasmius oreades]KAG7089405.1 hypothetical protein E1B28_011093 [Marasmius oreades]